MRDLLSPWRHARTEYVCKTSVMHGGAGTDPIEIIHTVAEPCEPADTFLYRNMGSSFVANLPLFYFSSLSR